MTRIDYRGRLADADGPKIVSDPKIGNRDIKLYSETFIIKPYANPTYDLKLTKIRSVAFSSSPSLSPFHPRIAIHNCVTAGS